VVVDADNRVLGSARQPTPVGEDGDAIAAAMANSLQESAEQAGLSAHELTGVGVGSPGTIDPARGTVTGASNLGWKDPYPLAAELTRLLDCGVSLGNDVQVATEAEFHLGAGRPFRSVLGVFWGTGVGGGLILDGRPWHGRGAAGEIGHMVVERNGARCPCGRRGCLEAYAGRAAMEARARDKVADGVDSDLFKIMKQRGRSRLTSGIWQRALDADDQLAIHLIDRAVKALGAGIASAVNLLDVEAVIIGGGLGVRLGEPFVSRIADAMGPHLFVSDRPPAVDVAELGDLGGAIGASLLVDDPERSAPAR